jgi:hypothetical protein
MFEFETFVTLSRIKQTFWVLMTNVYEAKKKISSEFNRSCQCENILGKDKISKSNYFRS